LRKLPFVRLIDLRYYSESQLISWILNRSKLRGAKKRLENNLPEIKDTLNTPIYQVQKNIETVYDLTALSGLRADAPTENKFTYFATDLNTPIWWNPVTEVWVSVKILEPDTTAPTFSLSPSQTSYTITEGDAFFVPTLTLTDDIDGTSTPSPTSNTVDTSTVGEYSIVWSGLSDEAGNVIADVTVNVTVEAIPDTTSPTFSLSPSQTSYTITEGDAFFVPTLTLTDNVDGSSTPSPTSNSVDTSTAGSYVVTWSGLSDEAGNAIADVTVNVVVEVAPDINAPTFSLSPSQTSYTITEGDAFFVPTLTLTDDVDGTSTPSPTSNNVDTSTAGNYEITWSGLSDSAGNVIEDVTVSVEVAEVVDEVLIKLRSTANSFYSLSSPFQPAGNFEIEFDLITTVSDSRVGLTADVSAAHTYLRMEGNGTLRLKPNPESSPMNSTTIVNDGKSNKIKMVGGAAGCSLYINGVFETSDSQDWSDFGVVELGRRGDGEYLDGIMSKIKLTDITTPANSLELKLNKLTGNSELPDNNVFGSELYNFSNVGKTGDGNVASTGVSSFDVEITNTSDRRSYVNFDTVIGQLYQVTLDVDSAAWFIRAGSSGSGNVLVSANSSTPFGTQFFTAETTTTSVMLESIGVLGTYSHSNMSMQSISNLVTYQNIPEDARETYSLIDGFYFSSERVINGALNNGAPEWEYFGEWTILNDTATRINGSGQDFRQRNILIIGETYQASVDVLALESGGSLGMWNSSIITIATTTGKATINFTSSLDRLTLLSSSEITIDNISAKRVIEVAAQGLYPVTTDMTLTASWAEVDPNGHSALGSATAASIRVDATISDTTEGILMESGAASNGVVLYVYDGVLYFQCGNGSAFGTSTNRAETSYVLPSGTFDYVVEVSADITNSVMYIDSVLVDSQTFSNGSVCGSDNGRIYGIFNATPVNRGGWIAPGDGEYPLSITRCDIFINQVTSDV
jgi:hypothetical protein